MSAIIPLTQQRCAIIDQEDLVKVLGYNWVAVQSRKGGDFYARSTSLPYVYMHRLLCSGEIVDHCNGDTLDNTKSNLRPATRELNQANRKKRKGSAGPYKNVSMSKGYWVAEIRIQGKTYEKWGLPTAEAARDLVEQWKLAHWGFDPCKDRK